MEYLPCRKKSRVLVFGMNRLRNLFEHVFLSALVNTLYCTVLYVLMYLSMRAFLQRGLCHNVALHAHLELRDLCWYTAITRRPQCSQELSSSDRVHYHSPILTQREQQVRVSKDAITLLSNVVHFIVCVFHIHNAD